jgi:hypothetical protein
MYRQHHQHRDLGAAENDALCTGLDERGHHVLGSDGERLTAR